MKKLLLMTTIAFATMAASPAPSATKLAAADTTATASQQASGPVAAKESPAAEEKKTCKLLPSSGTRFAKRACLTDKQWKQVEAEVERDNGY